VLQPKRVDERLSILSHRGDGRRDITARTSNVCLVEEDDLAILRNTVGYRR